MASEGIYGAQGEPHGPSAALGLGSRQHGATLRGGQRAPHLQRPGLQINILPLEPQQFALPQARVYGQRTSISLNEGWIAYNLDDPFSWVGIRRVRNLATLLSEEDHIAVVKRFFIESIHQLREELTGFKKEHPDLPWAGE